MFHVNPYPGLSSEEFLRFSVDFEACLKSLSDFIEPNVCNFARLDFDLFRQSFVVLYLYLDVVVLWSDYFWFR